MIDRTGHLTPTEPVEGAPDRSHLRARVGNLVSRARLVLVTLPPGEARAEGERALDHADRFARGEPIEPRAIEDCLMNEEETGILLYEQSAAGALEQSVWSAVSAVVGYAAWAASAARSEPPGALVENYDLPEALAIVEDALRAAQAVVG